MTSGQTSDVSTTDDDDEISTQRQQRRHCDISSMGKMIVTIGGTNDNKEASVSSGKLLVSFL
jgi:hypothetical protein